MIDYEWPKMLGINGGVLATVTLTEIETVLSIALLCVTLVWAVVKLFQQLKHKDD